MHWWGVGLAPAIAAAPPPPGGAHPDAALFELRPQDEAEAEPEAPEQAEDPPPLPPRHTNPGFGLGVTALGDEGAVEHGGLAMILRKEEAVGALFQLNLSLSAGFTRPDHTADVARWGWRAGGTITDGYGDVADWVRDGRGTESKPFRDIGAMYAYLGLTVSYLVVPVTWILSPLASTGHAVTGLTLSVHTRTDPPNLYVEAGFGGAVFGAPVTGLPAVGAGPILGLGTQVGYKTVGARLLVSPPALNVDTGGGHDTVWMGEVTLGL